MRLSARTLIAALTGAFTIATVAAAVPALAEDVPPSATVRINEIESSGDPAGDWIELVNTGTADVDISGWLLKDDDESHTFTIPAGTTIAPGDHLAFVVEASFGLGNPDSARVFDGSTLVDSYSWTGHAATTYGRCPDGTGAFATTLSSTRGAANACAAPGSTIKINEVESSGDTSDWVELVNTGSTAEDLSNWVVKDNDDSHSVTIPAGTTLAPGAFLAVDTEPAFGLGNPDSARVYNAGGALIDSHTWAAHASTTYGRCPDGTGAFVTTTASTRGAANACAGPAASPVKINEVESDGGADFVELVNTGSSPVDISGYVVKDNDDSHSLAIPSGTTLAAGAFLAVSTDPPFGLGGGDSARLYDTSSTLIDSYSWTSHATTTYGRCPDGTGPFVVTTGPTPGAPNGCPIVVAAQPWPGGPDVSTVDEVNVLGGDMSGLYYEPGVLWAAKNGPGTLFRLVPDGSTWVPDTSNGWGAGKTVRYPDGTGDPDAEGITVTSTGIYVATERDNADSGVSRPAVLRFDPSSPSTTLNAVEEWVLTGDLPAVGPNLGLEAIAFVPDSFLTGRGFIDESTGSAYDPADYPGHGEGLFFVGLEANGLIYAYALQSGGAFHRVATIPSGFPGVMDLAFEPESGHLWAVCDDTCEGRSATLDIDGTGVYAVTNLYERPAGQANLNNEGFAVAPQSECIDGLKPVFWADDANTDGHALRAGTLACTPLIAGPGTMPQTGVRSGLIAGLGAAALLLGVVLVVLSRRRRRPGESAA